MVPRARFVLEKVCVPGLEAGMIINSDLGMQTSLIPSSRQNLLGYRPTRPLIQTKHTRL